MKHHVKVWNCTLSGKRFLEGYATLVKRLDVYGPGEERWLVKFDGDEENELYPRFILREGNMAQKRCEQPNCDGLPDGFRDYCSAHGASQYHPRTIHRFIVTLADGVRVQIDADSLEDAYERIVSNPGYDTSSGQWEVKEIGFADDSDIGGQQ
jgi:hypothetical protein